MAIKVFIVDDHRMIIQGLRRLLESEPELEVVGDAVDGRAAVAEIAELRPDVVVMDLQMPELHGLEATRQVLNLPHPAKIVGLSGRSDPQATREMLNAGASGYVLKDAEFGELATAIRTVAAGQVYISPAISERMGQWQEVGLTTDPSAVLAGGFRSLSPREREVIQLLAEGKSTKEAAACLHVSPKTVETHRRNLMEKIHVESIAELTKYAIREGITTA